MSSIDPAEDQSSPASSIPDGFEVVGHINQGISTPPPQPQGPDGFEVIGHVNSGITSPQASPAGVGDRMSYLAGGSWRGNIAGVPVPSSIEAGLAAVGAAINPKLAVGANGDQVRQDAATETMANLPRPIRPVVSGFAQGIGGLTALGSRALGAVTPGLDSADQGNGVSGLVASLEQGRKNNGTSTLEDLATKGVDIGAQVALLGGAGTAAPALMAAQGAESGLESSANGSPTEMLINAGGQAALSFLLGKLLPGQKVNDAVIKKFMPELQATAADAIKRTLLQGGVNAGEGAVFQLASNAIQNLAGNNVDLTQGVGENALTQGITGAAIHGIHEAQGKVTSPAAAVSPQAPGTPSRTLTDFQVKSREGETKGQVIDFATPEEKAQYIVNNKGFRGPILEDAKAYLESLKTTTPTDPVIDPVEAPILDEVQKQIDANKELIAKNNEVLGKAPPAEVKAETPFTPEEQAVADEIQKQISSNQKTIQTNKSLLGDKNIPAPTALPKDSAISKLKELVTNESGAVHMSMADLTGPGSVYREEVKPHLDKAANAAVDLKNFLRQTYNPGGNTDLAKGVKGIFRSGMAKADLIMRKAEVALESARRGFEKLPEANQFEFQSRMDSGQPQGDPSLDKIAKAMYEDTNDGRKQLANLGVDAANNWHEEWWNRLWKKDDAKAAQMLSRFGQAGKLEGRAGFLKSRTIEDWTDALKMGLVPRFTNPVDMFLATKAERTRFIATGNALKDLADTGLFSRFKGKVLPMGWEKPPGITNKLADTILPGDGIPGVPTAVAEVLKNVVTPSAVGSNSGFRLLAETNSTLTQLALSLSGFHLFKVGTESMAMQVGRAVEQATKGEYGNAAKSFAHAFIAPLEAPIRGKKIQDQLLGKAPATPEEKVVLDAMLEGGQRVKEEEAWKSHFRRRFQKAVDQGGVNGWIRAGLNAPFALNEAAMQKVIFDFVQRAKLFHGFEQTKDALGRLGPSPDLYKVREEAGKVSDHLDNVMGLMVRDNLFWNKTARDLATLSMLSVGWNYGAKRALTRGVLEAGKGAFDVATGKPLKSIDSRSASYIAAVGGMQAMAGAALTYLATGKGPQALIDYVFPPTGKEDKNGHAIRLRLPFYTGDWYDFITAPVETLQHKASPIIHAATSIAANKDYFGTKIRNEDDKWYQQAFQIAKYVGELGKPFSVRQLQDTISGKGTAANTGLEALPFLGIRLAAKKHSYSDAEVRARSLIGEQLPAGGRTREAADHSQMVSTLADSVRDGEVDAKDKVRDAYEKGQLTQSDIERIKEQVKSPLGITGLLKNSSLEAEQVMSVWDRMTPKERVDTVSVVATRIRNSKTLTADKRSAYLQQVKDEYTKAKGD